MPLFSSRGIKIPPTDYVGGLTAAYKMLSTAKLNTLFGISKFIFQPSLGLENFSTFISLRKNKKLKSFTQINQ